MKNSLELEETISEHADLHSASEDQNANFPTQKECEKFNNHTLLEGMTSISALIAGIRDGINTRRIEKIYFDESKIKSKAKELGFLRAVSSELGFSIEITNARIIENMTIGTTHGGVIAQCTERPLPSLEDAISTGNFLSDQGFFVLLEGIEDPYNFGYALRSLYAAGVDGVILCPRNWMGAAGVVARSSAGASERLPMAVCEPEIAVSLFHRHQYRVICAGIRDSVGLYEADMSRPLLLVVGGEKRGISRAVLDQADTVVRIDYGREFRGSLSAASAATVLGFEVLRQNQRS
jgi:23S rRNA (guanosine2251-2'-O)-methyltransferase